MEDALANTVTLASDLSRPPTIIGSRNEVSVGRNARLSCTIEVVGNDNRLVIGDGVYIGAAYIGIKADGASILIGNNTTIGGGAISAHETGSIVIGEDCIISTEVFMDCSDMHPIYDAVDFRRINPAKNIVLGDHVWIGYRTIITKGAIIGRGSVAAAGSVVTGVVPEGCAIGGNPAKVLREAISWTRNFVDTP